jgi:hypothetical protein
MSEPAIGWISEVVLDGSDPWVLARFWAGLLGGTPVEWYPGSSRPAPRRPASRSRPGPAPDGEPVPWRVYRDPAGHLFCLVIR